MNRLLFSLLFIVSFTACEKNIDFKLQESNPTLVVDAEIENGSAPRVMLTKSFSYYSQLSATALLNSFVHDAEVYISNGQYTHRMKEFTYPIFPGLNGYYYGIDSSSLNTAFVGELNTSYQLRIVADGKEYRSQTSITPLNIKPDSIYFKPAPFNPDTNKRVMMIKITEPAGLGNYIRYFTKRNSEPFFPGFNSVFSDEVIDGSTITFQLEPGVNRNDLPKPGDNFFMKGDTVSIRYSNIDRSAYTFWSTWEFSQQSIGNPFAQPVKVLGNVSNGALGAFCGYASWYNTYIVD